MFEVRTVSPLDARWEERDKAIKEVAGKPAGSGTVGKARHHVWLVPEFEQAQLMRELLDRIDGVHATIREH